MLGRTLPLTLILLTLSASWASAQHEHHEEEIEPGPPPLYDNLGKLHRAIRTSSVEAQKYFDQGLRLTYGFNHAEAVRAFEHATELDSACAMCWWGIALALGPNINLPMPPEANATALDAAGRAMALAAGAGPRDKALIEALAARYSADTSRTRARLDSAYATRMRAVAKGFPDDADAGTLFAESMMLLRPWRQWKKNGSPEPGTLEVVATLERLMARFPEHPGACHFYIHAIEASRTPEKALPCATRLPGLMPGAGHLVHMPAHIAMRVGDYSAAILHNEHATRADRAYLDGPHTASIYGVAYNAHNWHFLSSAAAFAGRSALAIEAARKAAAAIPLEVVQADPTVEYWMPLPWLALVRFGRWEDMLAEAPPPRELRYTKAMWHFAHGMALAAMGDEAGATRDADSLAVILSGFPDHAMVASHPAATMLGIASECLAGELAVMRGDDDLALNHLNRAVYLDDGLQYDEPPPSYIPPRQLLGRELLRQEMAKQAEGAFRDDLRQHRENGWSLHGLAQALRAGKRVADAKLVEQRFQKAWREADVEVGF